MVSYDDESPLLSLLDLNVTRKEMEVNVEPNGIERDTYLKQNERSDDKPF